MTPATAGCALARFVVTGAPRTKKNSPQIVRNLGRALLIPSEAFKKWHKVAMSQAPLIRRALLDDGVTLPIVGEINVKAIFYRERDTGDLLNYLAGLTDWLQESAVSKSGRPIRQGAGIIRDDKQIVSCDGSRLLKDAADPRIEVEITAAGRLGQAGLGV